MSETFKIGVVGNGVMGSAIAARFLATGNQVFVRDHERAKMDALVQTGAVATDSASALTASVDIVIMSLNTADIVEDAVFGDDGIAQTATASHLLIDMSSIDPGRTAQLSERLKAHCGTAWVDAPLSGGAPAAANGALTLMLGGHEDDVARARTVLAHIAANMTHMGESGAGQTVKLINQVLCAANFLAVAEATRLALDGGVDATRIPAALAGGRADSAIMQEYMAKMARLDYTPTGRIDNMLKDLESAQAFAFSMRTPMPLTSLITDMHRMIERAGIGPEDSAAYMKLFDLGRSH